ncbi:hypothetical protein NX059_001091 [Plenodomus lindquistii]|nr:hypothetical protein NX059_001091 [Plenodomus lindquistii]
MFSPAIGRAARSANTLSAAPASCFLRTALNSAPQQCFRPGHQRRLSSSKPAPPPSSKKKAAAVEENVSVESEGAGRASAGTKKKQKEAAAAIPKHNIPYVGPTEHMNSADVKFVSFFGLHRPMSPKRSLPHPTSTAEFNALFDPARARDTQRIQAINSVLQNSLNTLNNVIDNLEGAHTAQSVDFAEHAAEQDESMFHLDQEHEHWRYDMHAWGQRLLPFAPPPAPTPYDALTGQLKAIARSLSGGNDGAITQVPLPALRVSRSTLIDRLTPFRQHVARRRYRPGMLLISVKRQRKLKMKKHKYKKLMKKTRLLRRKLDRL